MFDNSFDTGSHKSILDFTKPLDYRHLMECLDIFAQRYDFITLANIGNSMMGRPIPLVKIGAGGNRSVLYVGTHHGMEWITSVILLRFINEFCELYKKRSLIYGLDLSYIYNTRSIYIVPMLNPDGAELQINGLDENNPLRERLVAMNPCGTDFTLWQANERGVDLNHNYNAGFMQYKELEYKEGITGGAPTRYSGEYAESEPEVAAMCSFIRSADIDMVLTFHTQGEEIFYTSGGQKAHRSQAIGKVLAKLTGYKLAEPEGMAAYGGLTDWFIQEFRRPSFTIECGKGTNPLPLNNFFPIYIKLREMLFCAPVIM